MENRVREQLFQAVPIGIAVVGVCRQKVALISNHGEHED